MSDLATPPIVTDDHGDIALHGSVEAACQEMEAIDVRDGVYDVFDSRGHRLSLGVSGGLVQIWLDPQAEREPDELARRLRHFMTRVGTDRVGVHDIEAASLDDAIHALARFFNVR